jgi:hypothetical protein
MLESLTKHGNVVKKLKNTSYLLFLSCLAMEGINYKHMWWAHRMGNGGSFVEFYNYKFPHRTSPGKLRKENFSANSAVFIGKEENGYLYELLMARHVTNTFLFGSIPIPQVPTQLYSMEYLKVKPSRMQI